MRIAFTMGNIHNCLNSREEKNIGKNHDKSNMLDIRGVYRFGGTPCGSPGVPGTPLNMGNSLRPGAPFDTLDFDHGPLTKSPLYCD